MVSGSSLSPKEPLLWTKLMADCFVMSVNFAGETSGARPDAPRANGTARKQIRIARVKIVTVPTRGEIHRPDSRLARLNHSVRQGASLQDCLKTPEGRVMRVLNC